MITKNLIEDLNSPLDIALYTEAMGKALTLLKNDNDLLPLKNVNNLGHIPLGDSTSDYFQSQLSKYQNTTTINKVTQANV